MHIQWDITPDVSAASFGVGTQQTHVRAKSRVFAVMAIVAGALFSSSETSVITTDPVQSSSGLLMCQSVPRTQPTAVRVKRGDRSEYDTDGQHGLSTARLGGMFSILFAPCEEAEPEIDYSFG